MYKTCLIGHGYWGKKLARNFHNSEYFNLTSVVDKNNTNLHSAKKKYPFAKFYKDYKNNGFIMIPPFRINEPN